MIHAKVLASGCIEEFTECPAVFAMLARGAAVRVDKDGKEIKQAARVECAATELQQETAAYTGVPRFRRSR